jgi:hypothetical protein
MMVFTPRKLACLVFLLAVCVQTSAQQPSKPNPSPIPTPDDDVIRITTNVVQVDAIVTDKDGKLVMDLKAEDFEIIEEGKTVKPEYFLFIPLIAQTVEQTEGGADGETPVAVDQLKRTFVFLVDNPLIDVSLSSSNAVGVNSATFTLRARAVRAGEEAEKLAPRVTRDRNNCYRSYRSYTSYCKLAA